MKISLFAEIGTDKLILFYFSEKHPILQLSRGSGDSSGLVAGEMAY